MFSFTLKRISSMKTTIFLSAISFLFLSFPALPQRAKMDSLLRVVQAAAPDTTKVDALNKLSFLYRRANPDSMILLAAQADSLAVQLGYLNGRAKAVYHLGIGYDIKQNTTEASRLFQKAAELAMQANNTTLQNSIMFAEGILYSRKRQFDRSDSVFVLLKAGYQKSGNAEREASTLIILAINQRQQANFNKSEALLREALLLSEEVKKPELMANCKFNLAHSLQGNYKYSEALALYQELVAYRKEQNQELSYLKTLTNMGLIYWEIQEEEKSIPLFLEAIAMAEKLDYMPNLINNLYNIGISYYRIGQYTEAKENYQKALKLVSGKDNCLQMRIASDLSDALMELQQADSARFFLQESYRLSSDCEEPYHVNRALEKYGTHLWTQQRSANKAMPMLEQVFDWANENNNLELISASGKTLAVISEHQNKTGQTVKYMKAYMAAKDTIASMDETKKVAQLQANYEFQKEKEQIESQFQQEMLLKEAEAEKQSLLTKSLAAGAFLLLGFAGFVFRVSQQRKQANALLSAKNEQISTQKGELQELDKLKGKLLSVLSHDLRSPMVNIHSALMLLQLEALDPATFRKRVAALEDQLGQTLSFMENLLKWAHNQLEEIRPNLTTVEVKALVDETLSILRHSAQEKEVQLIMDVSPAFRLKTDPEMLKLVVRNLAANAVKYCEKGDTVTVEAHEKPSCFQLSVKDTGRGISPELKEKLLSKAYISTEGTKKEMGTGIGLILTKEFVEKLNGTLEFESEEGKGTEFYIKFPMK